MISLTIKALLLIWPFLKRAIFKDRTATEVMLENKHVTMMFVMILVLLGLLAMVTSELSDVRSAHQLILAEKALEMKCTGEDVIILHRKEVLGELLK